MPTVDTWLHEVLPLLRRFQETFEARHGHPPGDNRVEPRTAGRTGDHDLPPQLGEFYEQVDAVWLEDLHHGYFVHPLDHVVDAEATGLPTRVPEVSAGRFVTFGSTGGGDLYAVSCFGGPVYRLPAARVVDNVYTSAGLPPSMVAEDFSAFLGLITAELRRALAPRQPPPRPDGA
ncbi:hypothetical protein [Saccharothrix hoggarensis]|uniref:SMI1/KNR4 family protein n=1 Tax=Saccharothrix hoggarensis TaxID=913853 RepID=A0ABW3R4L2_9PSEU